MLDISVLVALLDLMHLHHSRAFDWFRDNSADGWLTCPLTQNGCVRILSQPQYAHPLSVAVAMERLQITMSIGHHRFIPDDVSLLDDARVAPQRMLGHRQITDVYLLALAVAHDARLVTLDTRIPIHAVRGANAAHLTVI